MIKRWKRPNVLTPFVSLSLERCALPRLSLTETRWQCALDSWFPAIIRAGLHRLPPGIVLDVAFALHGIRVRWRASDAALAHTSEQPLGLEHYYAHAVRVFAGEFRHHISVEGSALVSLLVELLRQIVATGMASTREDLPKPPSTISPSMLMRALSMRNDHAHVHKRWQIYIERWLKLAAAGLQRVVDSRMAEHCTHVMTGRHATGMPGDGALEREVLQRIHRVRKEPLVITVESKRQSEGMIRQRFERGHKLPGCIGIEQSNAIERACVWQLALDRRLLIERLVSGQMTSFRQPRRAQLRHKRTLLLAWLDPSSLLLNGMEEVRQEYLAGKQLLSEVFICAVRTMCHLGVKNLFMGLVALPCHASPSFIDIAAIRKESMTYRDIVSNPYSLLSQFATLRDFVHRRPYHTCLNVDRARGRNSYSILSATAQALTQAVGDSINSSQLRVVLVMPDIGLASAGSKLPPKIDLASARRKFEIYIQGLIGAEVPLLAVHDVNGCLVDISSHEEASLATIQSTESPNDVDTLTRLSLSLAMR